MGVKDFNKIRDAYGDKVKDKVFPRIIVDASNLYHTYLAAWYSTLTKQYGKYSFGGVKADIFTQCAFIVSNTFLTMRNYIRGLIRKHSAEDIYLVLDPIQTPDYIIDVGEPWININYIRMMYPTMKINRRNRNIIHVNMKEKEQKRRQGVDPIKVSVEKVDKEMKTEYEDYGDELQKKMHELISNTMLLGAQHRIIILAESLLPLLIDDFANEKKVHFIRAKCEADLLIKNLAAEEPHVKTLIKSKDTDYYFLVSEFEWCYCSDITRDAVIYQPMQIWKDFLGDGYDYDIIIRLSPMFGNDYTAHKSVLNAQKVDDVMALLNNGTKFETLKGKRANMIVRKLYDIAEKYDLLEDISDDDPTDRCILDEMIRYYDADYFDSYYKSVAIYKQWGFYCDYVEIKKTNIKLPDYIHSAIVYESKDVDDEDWEEFVNNSEIITNKQSLENLFIDKIREFLITFQDYKDGNDCYADSSDEDEESNFEMESSFDPCDFDD